MFKNYVKNNIVNSDFESQLILQVYHWWRRGIWEQYPGTLYVTVKGITPPEQMPAALRSRSALQGEINQPSPFLDVDHTEAKSEDNENSTTLPLVRLHHTFPETSLFITRTILIFISIL